MSGERWAISAARVVTCDPQRTTPQNPTGAIDDAAVVLDGGRLEWVGPRAHLPRDLPVVEHRDAVLTPGLVDAHTHAAWVGSRHNEYAVRMAGGDYQAIAAAGGGILATQRAVEKASEDELTRALGARLRRMTMLGVTTVEVKSGYGLTAPEELKQLRAISRAAVVRGVAHVVPTFLALHALPVDARANRSGYVDDVTRSLLPLVASEGLATSVDAYVDQNAFSVDEAKTVMLAARRHGLAVRMHVGQFADVGGAELAAELGALSVDHLEHVSPEAIDRLAGAGTHAVLLPVASFTLGQAPPPIASLRQAGVPLVVASDANPGTAPSESLPLALAMAVRHYGLSPAEAIVGSTRLAARALGLEDRGALVPGSLADLVVWDLPHETAIVMPWGTSRVRWVVKAGEPVDFESAP